MDLPVDPSNHRIDPGTAIDLSTLSTNDNGGLSKDEAKPLQKALNKRLEELQENLYAHGKERVLVVLQATDTGGKDGTIRAVFDGTNPQGVKVASFGKPTDEELAHDYLWRVHKHAPMRGDITIFNRSHYEDVLVVRVHDLVPEAIWSRRYAHIRNFEQMLADEGVTIRKFFLHISKDEQRQRLQDRIDEPAKHWKFSFGDLEEREHWDAYQQAFGAMLTETSTEQAPWFAVPADRKWYRNLVITGELVRTLEGIAGDQFPPDPELDGVVVE
jgi:PPK2 family polyphosphate:nucleotide phosphotransferase